MISTTTGSFRLTGAHENDSERADAPVQLTAHVSPDGHRFVATVDGLDLEGKGNTPDAARESLVQAMRGWLERLDTTGKLGDALGVEGLSEDTEIVLQFSAATEEDQEVSQ